MRRILVGDLEAGQVVGAPVYDEPGRLLLAAGVALTAILIKAIRRRGYTAVYIRDGAADDIPPEDLVSHRVRETTVQHIHELYRVSQAAIGLTEEDGASTKRIQAKQAVDRLSADVDRIMHEVTESKKLTALAALKSHDDYTFSHSVDVAVTSVLLGTMLYLPRDELRQLALGCLIHDIGKIFVPETLLRKPGPLSPAEFEIMKTHTSNGYRFLMEIGFQDFLASGITHQHHERQDGSGYPRGLHGANRLRRSAPERWDRERILPLAEIAAVADVYSAISSDRPYRATMPPEKVVATIKGMAGHHLNNEVVECFLANVPVFPIGAPVLIEGGRYAGFRGVVVENLHGQFDRPIVRITREKDGKLVTPEEFDPMDDSDARIVSPIEQQLPEGWELSLEQL